MMGKDVGDEAYRAISDREASDLLTLMKSCDHAVTNADLFVDDLSRQLNILDGDNIYSIMASEESINHLMNLLEIGIKNAESLESRCSKCLFSPTDYGRPMKHFFIEMQNFWAWTDNWAEKILGKLGYFQLNYRHQFWYCDLVHVFH